MCDPLSMSILKEVFLFSDDGSGICGGELDDDRRLCAAEEIAESGQIHGNKLNEVTENVEPVR